MRKIYCIGETVYDIIFKNSVPVAAKAGGSMLNACVSMGRTGLPAYFISEYGKDQIGNEIENFLVSCNVHTPYVYRFFDGKTSIAIAFLNEKNDASYTFYKQLPEKRLALEFPEINENDIILTGSFYAINIEIRPQITHILSKAKEAGAIIYYDPNFRKAHFHELELLKPMILENMAFADIVRGSNEDFEMIFGAKNLDDAYSHVSPYCETLIYTDASKSVSYKNKEINASIHAKVIQPVSTIGAGDNFNAGLIYGLFQENINKNQLEHLKVSQWQRIMQYGVDFASEVCMSYDNYISEDFAKSYKNKNQ